MEVLRIMVLALVVAPFAMALFPALIRHDKIRAASVYICGVITMVLAVSVSFIWLISFRGEEISFDLPAGELINHVILVGDIFLMALVIYFCVKYKKPLIALLSIVQTVPTCAFELFAPGVKECPEIRIDYLTFIMMLIIGIIGVAIGIYAVGYMDGYHNHHFKHLTDRRSFFLAMIFVFYGAMFGLVLSRSLTWMYFFWEITSITSFLLIGYTRSDEAVTNSFRALWMNLLGGLGMAIAICMCIGIYHTVDIVDVVKNAQDPAMSSMTLLPVALLAFGALTKSAQFPFSGWLLGAMVAPTPSSALLHSATMVKAGVYLLIRLSTAMNGNDVGQMVYLTGGFTFLAASMLAISQSDGKKVLAYSTISNLGLIVACAGAGYPDTVWSAVFLLIFHAVSKSLLFQCVGAIENTTGSRDIENMQGLATRHPKLAMLLMVGIAGMFLAPFGMLISKWAALKAFIDAPSALMVIFISFGSATTMFYWTKWFAKILGSSDTRLTNKDYTRRGEYISMFLHAILLVGLCLTFPLISTYAVEPMMMDMYGYSSPVISDTNIIIMVIMVIAIFVVPGICYLFTRNWVDKDVMAYMGGANVGDNERFVDVMGQPKALRVSNWYIENWFGEAKLFLPSVIISVFIIVLSFGMVVGGAFR